jgi:hypothetical protein
VRILSMGLIYESLWKLKILTVTGHPGLRSKKLFESFRVTSSESK